MPDGPLVVVSVLEVGDAVVPVAVLALALTVRARDEAARVVELEADLEDELGVGEPLLLMANWRPTVSGKKTYIVLLPFALSTPTEFPEYMQPYAKFAGQNTNRNFELTFTLPMGDLSDE